VLRRKQSWNKYLRAWDEENDGVCGRGLSQFSLLLPAPHPPLGAPGPGRGAITVEDQAHNRNGITATAPRCMGGSMGKRYETPNNPYGSVLSGGCILRHGLRFDHPRVGARTRGALGQEALDGLHRGLQLLVGHALGALAVRHLKLAWDQ